MNKRNVLRLSVSIEQEKSEGVTWIVKPIWLRLFYLSTKHNDNIEFEGSVELIVSAMVVAGTRIICSKGGQHGKGGKEGQKRLGHRSPHSKFL